MVPSDGMRRSGADSVLVETGLICRITFNLPEKLNAVDASMLDAATQAVRSAAGDEKTRVMVLTGAGRAFCAGAQLGQDDGGGVGIGTVDAANRLVGALLGAPVPVVCALNGVAAGVGVSLALACDIVVAHETASLVLAFTRVGLMPDGGSTALVAAALGRSKALELALLAEGLSARDALAAGLVSSVSPDETFVSAVEHVVDRLSAGPTAALVEAKRAINAFSLPQFDEVLVRERSSQDRLLNSPDFEEGADAFRNKRPPRFSDRPLQ